MNRKSFIGLILFSPTVVALGWSGEIGASIASLTFGLVGVAAVVFAIVGIWMSLLNPDITLVSEPNEKQSRKLELAKEMSPVFQDATYILIAGIAVRLILFVGPGIGANLSWLVGAMFDSWKPNTAQTIAGNAFEYILSSFTVFLYLWLAALLVFTLLPLLVLKQQEQLVKTEEFRDTPAARSNKYSNRKRRNSL